MEIKTVAVPPYTVRYDNDTAVVEGQGFRHAFRSKEVHPLAQSVLILQKVYKDASGTKIYRYAAVTSTSIYTFSSTDYIYNFDSPPYAIGKTFANGSVARYSLESRAVQEGQGAWQRIRGIREVHAAQPKTKAAVSQTQTPEKPFLPKHVYDSILTAVQRYSPPLQNSAYLFLDGVIRRDVLKPIMTESSKRFGNSIETSRKMVDVAGRGAAQTKLWGLVAWPENKYIYKAVRAAMPAAKRKTALAAAAVIREFIDTIFTRMFNKGWDHYYAKKDNVSLTTGLVTKVKSFKRYRNTSWLNPLKLWRYPGQEHHISGSDIYRGLQNTNGTEANADFQAVFKSVFGARDQKNLDTKLKEMLLKRLKQGPPL